MKKVFLKLLSYRTKILFFSLYLFYSFTCSQCNAESFYDWEDINKTMSAIELTFRKNQKDKLILMSDNAFSNKMSYKVILSYIPSYDINLGYTKEKCIKEFSIVKGRYSNYNLQIVFIKKENKFDGQWIVTDAYLENKTNKQKYKPKELQEIGFNPSAVEYNFNNLIKYSKNSKFKELAPFGKISISFFKNNTISKTENSIVFITNIILYKNNHIKDLIFIKLKYYPQIINNKRGWLITEMDSMLNYYHKYESKDSEVLLLTKNMTKNNWLKNITSRNYDLSKRSNYFFAITSINDVIVNKRKKAFLNIMDIRAPTVQRRKIVLFLLLGKGSILNNSEFKATVQNNQLMITFNGHIHVSKNIRHKYLTVFSADNILSIISKNIAPYKLTEFMVDKTYIINNRLYIELIK